MTLIFSRPKVAIVNLLSGEQQEYSVSIFAEFFNR